MKNAVALVLILILVVVAFWFYQSRMRSQLNPDIAEFHKDAERLQKQPDVVFQRRATSKALRAAPLP